MRTIIILLLATACFPVAAQDVPDAVLQARLNALVQGFEGRIGLYVRHLPTGRSAAIEPDSLFPTASMIKVPILVRTFAAIEEGALDYRQPLLFRDSLRYAGEDLLGAMQDSTVVPLDQVALLMITMSDNTAALWLQQLCGTGTAINEWLSAHGFEHTRMNSRTPGRRGDWERYGWGQTSPREIAELLVRIREGRAVAPAADERMYRILTRSYWDDAALSQIPAGIQVASKQGAVSAARSEVLLVHAPHGDYVFSVLTDDQADTRWAADNAGTELIRSVSALLWSTFEPENPWTPAVGIEAYR